MADKKQTATALAPKEPSHKKKARWKDHWGTYGQWGAIIAMGLTFLYNRYSDHASEYFNLRVDKLISSQLQPTTTAINGLGEKIARLEGKMEVLLLKNAASTPAATSSVKDVTDVLVSAKQNNLKLDPEILKDSGQKFISAAAKQPIAWTAVSPFLTYRSFLNVEFLPAIGESTPLELTQKWSNYRESVTVRPNPAHPETHAAFELLYAGGHVTPETSARLERLGHPQSEASGVRFFILNGSVDTIVLDGTWMKNVIIRNANVDYDGGNVILENVYFVNCTFVSLRLTPNSRRLSSVLLASASTTFKTITEIGRREELRLIRSHSS